MADFNQKKPRDPLGFLNIAHRGASAYAPENTVASFEEAIARNADMVEFDLRRTSDGVIVLHHDDNATIADGKVTPVSRLTFSELDSICSQKGYQLAVFEDILIRFGDKIAFNIEIKIGGMEREIARLLKAHPPSYEPVVSSFKPEIIRKIKKLDHTLTTGLIVGSQNLDFLNALARPLIKKIFGGQDYDNFHLHKNLVSHGVVEGLVDAGYAVYVWTVNDPGEIRQFLDMGVTGIISDMPDRVYDICLALSERQEILVPNGNINYKFSYAPGLSR